jgi:phosphogluconate dehydratase
MNPVIEQATQDIIARSKNTRADYLERMKYTMRETPPRKRLSCGNLAHAFAACSSADKDTIANASSANLGIVTAYNDMLSAHQPFKDYPDQLKQHANKLGATAQIASGVPAMCDGVTQGQAGMELSLFSRDIVAMATAVGLSHNMFDGNLFLGVCDKIVPGMLIGALEFGHLPAAFIPAGPMPSGLSNQEKASKRQQFAQGKINIKQLLAVESASYHSPGTCTFYGTANSNQMLVEMLGVQLAGASFIQPGTDLRRAMTKAAVDKLLNITKQSDNYRPLYEVITEYSLVNSVVGLLATGGSTNHSIHLVAIANAAGIQLTWEDIDKISNVVPLIAKVYPNGKADINHFQSAGGMAYLIHQLRSAELLNENVVSIMGEGLDHYVLKPSINDKGAAQWIESVEQSNDLEVLADITQPFAENGGLQLLTGNIGKAVIKVSAVSKEHFIIEAPTKVFHSQEALKQAFDNEELYQDHIAVVRFQGPAANGMPELHKMTPLLGVVQDKGYKVALVTDGRMSGASGKVPAAIHVSPEAITGGIISKIQDGDIIRLDAIDGTLQLLVSDEELANRIPAIPPQPVATLGRPLFDHFRRVVSNAENGASSIN